MAILQNTLTISTFLFNAISSVSPHIANQSVSFLWGFTVWDDAGGFAGYENLHLPEPGHHAEFGHFKSKLFDLVHSESKICLSELLPQRQQF